MKSLAWLSACNRYSSRPLMAVVRAYRLLLSPWLGNACRFTPTCSSYAIEALQRHGAAQGSYLALSRLIRCQPWCQGGHDPVPADFQLRLLSRLISPPFFKHSQKKHS